MHHMMTAFTGLLTCFWLDMDVYMLEAVAANFQIEAIASGCSKLP